MPWTAFQIDEIGISTFAMLHLMDIYKACFSQNQQEFRQIVNKLMPPETHALIE